jgi:hypothetical protein
MPIKAIITIAVVIFAGVGFLSYQIFGPGYYSELNAVRRELEKIPSVQILKLDGVHDILRLKLNFAKLAIEGKGQMVIVDLDRHSFGDVNHVRLRSIGPLRFDAKDYPGLIVSISTGKPMLTSLYSFDADIGPEGEFAKMFPFKINNIQTAIAKYDDILRVVSSWPREPSLHFRGSNTALRITTT